MWSCIAQRLHSCLSPRRPGFGSILGVPQKLLELYKKGSDEMDLGRLAVRGKVVAPSLEKLLNQNQSGNIFSPPFNKIAKKKIKTGRSRIFFFKRSFIFVSRFFLLLRFESVASLNGGAMRVELDFVNSA